MPLGIRVCACILLHLYPFFRIFSLQNACSCEKITIIYVYKEFSMCVALPGVVTEVFEDTAMVDFSGSKVEAASGLIDVSVGDRVLVHAGCILQIVSQSEAEEMQRLFTELGGIA